MLNEVANKSALDELMKLEIMRLVVELENHFKMLLLLVRFAFDN